MKLLQFVLLITLLVLPLSASGGQGDVGLATTPLVSVTQADGWYVGTRFQIDGREFEVGSEVVELDVNHIVAQLGYRIVPSMMAIVEAGSCKTELPDDVDGENGIELAGALSVNVLEHALVSSPVVGKKHVTGLLVDVEYRYCESNLDDRDMNWRSLVAMPSVYYLVNRRGDAVWEPFEPNGIALRGGLVFQNIEGDYGTEDLAENRDFGFMIATDIYSESGWVTQIMGRFFGSNDHTLGVTVGYNF